MDFNQFDLPIVNVLDDISASLTKENTLIVSAPPGAGKSTLLPLKLLHAPWLKGKKIMMLEPRRLAAKTIAKRMSDLLNETVGQTIGYRVRFESKTSSSTKIEVVTEGILTRMLQSDNELTGIGLIIFDEFHERSIHADVSLALSRECQAILRNDLRILLMSATLNIETLSHRLHAPVIESFGRQYPVDVFFAGGQEPMLIAEMTAQTVQKAIQNHQKGDVLVFLPGQAEIRKCEEILRFKLKGIVVMPLYGQLPPNKQIAAIMPIEGKRKVVLATSIAETSLTIEGVRIVVDSGYSRISQFDHHSALSRLETVQVSQDSANQRAGRAGRLGPGVCYKMWSKATELQLKDHRTPEILEADLCALALDLAMWGIDDPYTLDWISPPPKGALMAANSTLTDIGALDNHKITSHGKTINSLPCHPRIGHMLLEAQSLGLLGLACDVAALIEEKDPMSNEAGIDINDRLKVLRRFRSENTEGKKWNRIEKVSQSYRSLFNIFAENETVEPYEIGLLLAYAYPERIACARPGNNAQFQLANGRFAMASHKDDLAYESWLAIAHMNARDGMGKIFLASPLNPKDLANMVKSAVVITWNYDDDTLRASTDLRIGSIVLKSTPLSKPDKNLSAKAICDALKKEGNRLLDWSDKVKQFQCRVLSLSIWRKDENWPKIDQKTLLVSVETWLTPYLLDVRNASDLKKIDLLSLIKHHFLTYEQNQLLDLLAPKSLIVPSGSDIRLQYSAQGEMPILAARIQELFGQQVTPTVNEGNMKVLIHLLSPGFKPVQVTTDLENFWDQTYFEVRKELKGRYPKHHWPDNPKESEAVRGVKRKNKAK